MNDNDPLLLDCWRLHLKSLGRAERTIRTYLDSVRAFARWLDGKPLEDVDTRTLKAFVADQRDRCAPGTVYSRVMGLRLFYRWATEEGDILVAPPYPNENKVTYVTSPH